jgi:hypothetical protein
MAFKITDSYWRQGPAITTKGFPYLETYHEETFYLIHKKRIIKCFQGEVANFNLNGKITFYVNFVPLVFLTKDENGVYKLDKFYLLDKKTSKVYLITEINMEANRYDWNRTTVVTQEMKGKLLTYVRKTDLLINSL